MKTKYNFILLLVICILSTGCQYAGWHHNNGSLSQFERDWDTATERATEEADRKLAEDMAQARREDALGIGHSRNSFSSQNTMSTRTVGAMFRPMEIDQNRPKYLKSLGWRRLKVKEQTELQVTVFKMTREEGAIAVPPPAPEPEEEPKKEEILTKGNQTQLH